MYLLTFSFAACVAVLGCLLQALPATEALVLRDAAEDVTPVSTIYQWPNPTFVENLAVRSNGQVLITVISPADLYMVDPRRVPATATLLYSFPGVDSLFGITEIAPDVFAIAAGNISLVTRQPTLGSYSVWKADLRYRKPVFSKLADLPEAHLLNGMTTLSRREGTILISDSVLGLVWRLNTRRGDYAVALEDETMKVAPDAPIPVGVNGIRRLGDYLYYVNLVKALFCRVRIDPHTATATGPFEIIGTGQIGDDFAITDDGTGYVAGNPTNVIWKVTPDGTETVIAGNLNSSEVAGPTSAQFGRTKKEKGILYITTCGGLAAPINGTYTEGGKLLALRINEVGKWI